MGIDPSIRSTGICIARGTEKHKYYLIVSSTPKKFVEDSRHLVTVVPYEKEKTCLGGIKKECVKTKNVMDISKKVEEIIELESPDIIIMEAVAFQANGTIDQLAGLNYVIRYLAQQRDIPCFVVSPSSVKKHAVGFGNATKNEMISAWIDICPEFAMLKKYKIDDLADSFFMTSYHEVIIELQNQHEL